MKILNDSMLSERNGGISCENLALVLAYLKQNDPTQYNYIKSLYSPSWAGGQGYTLQCY